MPLFRSQIPQPASGPRHKQKYAYWYDSIIEWLLANPSGSVKDCAKALGRTPQTLYLVINSDIFKTRYEQRRKEHFDALSDNIQLSITRVAAKSMALLEKRIDESPEKITTKQVLDVSNATLSALGYGDKGPTTQVNVNAQPQVAVTVSSDVLLEARERMRQAQQQNATENPKMRQIAPIVEPAKKPGFDDILELTVNPNG